jgi:hypothetical protein
MHPLIANRLETAVRTRGDLVVQVRDIASGRIRRSLEVRNMIVASGYGALVSLLSTGDPGSALAKLRPGTGTVPPVISDTDITSPIAVPVSTDCPAGVLELAVQKTPTLAAGGPYDLLITSTIPGGTDADAYNGKTISEAGLITAGGTLFARQIHPSIAKVPTVAIDYEWRIRLLPTKPS